MSDSRRRSCSLPLQPRPYSGRRDEGREILASVVSLHDVADVEQFVRGTINRAAPFRGVVGEEFEELVLEGICIMYELAERFEPHRPGYPQPGRFSGFAAQFLPRRLGDAWHRNHPEHRYVTRDDGKREWEYLKPTVSLDAILSRPDAGSGLERRRDGAEARLLEPTKWVPVAAT